MNWRAIGFLTLSMFAASETSALAQDQCFCGSPSRTIATCVCGGMCGPQVDDCTDATVDCGGCPSGQACLVDFSSGFTVCQPYDPCGRNPQTALPRCGTVFDANLQETVQCPTTCPTGEVCTTSNPVGYCTDSCQTLGAQCGLVNNQPAGLGGQIDCGSCPRQNQTCKNNVCVSAPAPINAPAMPATMTGGLGGLLLLLGVGTIRGRKGSS